MRFALLLSLMLLCACGEDETDPPLEAFRNGERLVAQYVEVDGVQLFDSWYDIARKEVCSIATAPEPDGRWHCLPVERATIAPRYHDTFADADCTDPIVRVDDDASGNTLIVVDPMNRCAEPPRVHVLGEQLDAAYHRSSGGCYLTTGRFHRIGPALSLDDGAFVAGKSTVTPRSGAIASLGVSFDDGAYQLVSAYDTARGQRASLTQHEPLHFRPTQTAYVWGSGEAGHSADMYADASCSVVAASAIAEQAACPIGAAMGWVDDGVCNPYDERFFEIGESVAPSALHYLDDDGACVAGADTSGQVMYFEVTGKLPIASLPAGSLANVGDGRIKQRWQAAADGTPAMPTGELLDSELGVICRVEHAADGKPRCMPPQGDASAFADAACKQRLVATATDDACAPPLPAYVSAYHEVFHQYYQPAYRVGAEVRPAQLYRLQQDWSCIPTGSGSPDFRYFALSELEPTRLVAASEHFIEEPEP